MVATRASTGTPSSLKTSSSSLSFVQIGNSSFSPGDCIVESLLPRIRYRDSQRGSHSRDGQRSTSTPSSAHGLRHTNTTSTTSLNSNSSPFRIGGDEEGDDQRFDVLPLGDHPVVRRAQDECASLLNGNEVVILEDEDVNEDVVQLRGQDAELVFPCRNVFRYLVVFLKDLEHFVDVEVEIVDDTQTYRRLRMTNARSLAKIDGTSCQLPIVFGKQPGWRYACLDLHDLTERAFGRKHVSTTRIRIAGHCRILRLFFQDERYADADLPSYLSFLGSNRE